MLGSIGAPELIIILIVLLPPILVLFSRHTSGGTKLAWFLVSLFLSWLGYILFLVFTKKK